MKFIKENIFFVIIFMSIIIFNLYFLILPDKTFSNIENKTLTSYKNPTVQSILDKSYMENLENYINDQFPNRNQFISFNTNIKKYILLNNTINDVYFGKDGYLFTKYENIDENQLDKNKTELLNFYNNYNCKIYLIPSSFEILTNKLPVIYNNIEPNLLLEDIPNINYVDNILSNHKDEYIFYKTDHHWTTYGAYCLYKELYPNIKYETNTVSEEFLGTTHSKINIETEKDMIESYIISEELLVEYDFDLKTNTLYFDKHLETKDKYAYFLDGNHAYIKIINPNKNGKILIIKDSFANCFIPFLTNNYNEIHIVDLRYFNMSISTLINENQFDDIMIFYNKINFIEDKNIYKLNK